MKEWETILARCAQTSHNQAHGVNLNETAQCSFSNLPFGNGQTRTRLVRKGIAKSDYFVPEVNDSNASQLNRQRRLIWGCSHDRLRALASRAVDTLDAALQNGDARAAVEMLKAVGLYGRFSPRLGRRTPSWRYGKRRRGGPHWSSKSRDRPSTQQWSSRWGRLKSRYSRWNGWGSSESSPGRELVAVHRGTATCPCRRRHRRHGTGKDGKNLSRVVRIVALTEIVNWNSGRALLALDRYAF